MILNNEGLVINVVVGLWGWTEFIYCHLEGVMEAFSSCAVFARGGSQETWTP